MHSCESGCQPNIDPPLCKRYFAYKLLGFFSYIHFQVCCMKSCIPFFFYFITYWLAHADQFSFVPVWISVFVLLFFISNIYSINYANSFYLGHICFRLFEVLTDKQGVWTHLIYLGINIHCIINRIIQSNNRIIEYGLNMFH